MYYVSTDYCYIINIAFSVEDDNHTQPHSLNTASCTTHYIIMCGE